jgi:hypothetical protein
LLRFSRFSRFFMILRKILCKMRKIYLYRNAYRSQINFPRSPEWRDRASLPSLMNILQKNLYPHGIKPVLGSRKGLISWMGIDPEKLNCFYIRVLYVEQFFRVTLVLILARHSHNVFGVGDRFNLIKNIKYHLYL